MRASMIPTDTRVQLRIERIDGIAQQHGWGSDAEIARNLGIPASSISKMRAGTQGPGPATIHQIMTNLDAADYHDLFFLEELSA
jgi:hypothetical protein